MLSVRLHNMSLLSHHFPYATYFVTHEKQEEHGAIIIEKNVIAWLKYVPHVCGRLCN